MSATQSIHIEAPVQEVFNWFKNPRNWLMLNPAAERREELTNAHVTGEGPGTFHVWTLKPLPGVRFECFGVFTEVVQNKRIVDKWSLPFEGSYTYTFDDEGSGMRLTLQRHPRAFWRLWPLDKLMDRFEGPQNEKFLERLKTFMEAEGEGDGKTAAERGAE